MRSVVALLLLAGVAASGCIVEAQDDLRAAPDKVTFEPSMLPNFGQDAGPFYRLVQIHQHLGRSPAQEREWNDPNRPRVVCFRLDGITPAATLDSGSSSPSMDMAATAPCMPVVDAGRGRLFTNRSDFDERNPMGVAVLEACSGVIGLIQAAEPGFVARGPGRSFRIEFLANDTLLVDGRWHVQPGTTLKVEYVVKGPKPGGDDDSPAKFVIDYAGYWLVEHVGELGANEPIPPPRPTEGNGPQAWVPRMPGAIHEVLDPLAHASSEANERITMLRLTALHGRITDLRVALAGTETIEWFVAGGNETHLRLLGLIGSAQGSASAERFAFYNAFFRFPLAQTLADSKAPIEIRWQPEVALKSRMPVPWSETWIAPVQACDDGCSYVWTYTPTEDASWRLIEDPTTVQGTDALTLTVSETRDGAGFVRALYHRP